MELLTLSKLHLKYFGYLNGVFSVLEKAWRLYCPMAILHEQEMLYHIYMRRMI